MRDGVQGALVVECGVGTARLRVAVHHEKLPVHRFLEVPPAEWREGASVTHSAIDHLPQDFFESLSSADAHAHRLVHDHAGVPKLEHTHVPVVAVEIPRHDPQFALVGVEREPGRPPATHRRGPSHDIEARIDQ